MDQPESRSLPCSREGGFTILEVIIALTIFALVMTGLATSTALGLRLVSNSNGRQLAAQLATREIELLRKGDFSKLAMNTADTAALRPGTLDDNVDPVAQTFLVPDGPATPEALIRLSDGSVTQRFTTSTVQGFEFTILRYVTLVNDTTTTVAYKRVTVAAQWRTKAVGAPNRVVLSTLFSPGRVNF